MLHITEIQQYSSLADDARFADWYVSSFIPSFLPEVDTQISDAGKREMTLQARRYAEQFQINDIPSQYHFATLMWNVGPNFFTFPGFKEILQNEQLNGPEKIDQCYDLPAHIAGDAITGADDRWWYPELVQLIPEEVS